MARRGCFGWHIAPSPASQLQSEKDAAVQELKLLRDGTAGHQFAEMQERCKRLEGEREALETGKEKLGESVKFWKRSYDEEKEEKEKENKYYEEKAGGHGAVRTSKPRPVLASIGPLGPLFYLVRPQ